MDTPRLLAVIPAYNEEESLPATLKELAEVRPDVDAVVISDGSRDRTVEVARAMGREAVALPINLGIGGAVQTGLHYALRHGYDVAFQYDADGQHRPDQIELITKPLLEGRADVVLGSRFLVNQGYKTELHRRAMMWLLRVLSSLAIGQRISDNTSGFRAYNRKAMEFMVRNCSTDYPEIAAIILLTRSGYRYAEVPVQMRERVAGVSMFTPLRAAYFLVRSFMAIVVSVLETPIRKRRTVGGAS